MRSARVMMRPGCGAAASKAETAAEREAAKAALNREGRREGAQADLLLERHDDRLGLWG